MDDAKTLLFKLLAAIPDGSEVAPLFAEDGVVELPYLHSLGIPSRYEGRSAIQEFYGHVARFYPDLKFTTNNTSLLMETPDQIFAEYISHMTAAATGRTIHHLFVGRLVARKGEITLLREPLNVVAAAQALLPNGLADLPSFQGDIHSVPQNYVS